MDRNEALNDWGIMDTYTHEEFASTINKIYDDFENGIVADMKSIGTIENDFLLNGFDVSIPYLEAQPRQQYRIIIKEIDGTKEPNNVQ